ncbi:expressed unknown protein [Seminavis robusta]|uniref:Uncharacterized protein n=1 Tax=Seminavis robusta TaxID=568900 RepID=A0A9N8HT05_9STRA|nr:expressed unknown protein [Seminavis robusta]|eukprot:Sro1450_g273751.1  (175) ;mRNA; f:5498-6022
MRANEAIGSSGIPDDQSRQRSLHSDIVLCDVSINSGQWWPRATLCVVTKSSFTRSTNQLLCSFGCCYGNGARRLGWQDQIKARLTVASGLQPAACKFALDAQSVFLHTAGSLPLLSEISLEEAVLLPQTIKETRGQKPLTKFRFRDFQSQTSVEVFIRQNSFTCGRMPMEKFDL